VKTGHLTPRPARTRGEKSITWARFAYAEGVIGYRLCRRNLRGGIHYEQRAFPVEDHRDYIARELWHTRIRLREAVDARDLVHLGLEETA
jgi:hypothetical protein